MSVCKFGTLNPQPLLGDKSSRYRRGCFCCWLQFGRDPFARNASVSREPPGLFPGSNTYIHTYIDTYIHTYAGDKIDINIDVCVCIYIYMYRYKYRYTYRSIYIYYIYIDIDTISLSLFLNPKRQPREFHQVLQVKVFRRICFERRNKR